MDADVIAMQRATATKAANRANLSHRVTAIAPSATLQIDAKAKALAAAGESVINLSAGEPDFATSESICEAAERACRDRDAHRYSPSAGLPELRELVAEKTWRDSGVALAPSQVLITNGAKQAVFAACATILDPGDEVLLPAPYWTTYPEAISLAGGVPRALWRDPAAGFRLTVADLEASLTPKTKALVFVSPCNPTGAVYSDDEIAAIGRWACDAGLWVITDEIYEHLIYNDRSFHSMPALVPELLDRTLIVNGVAKTYAMTGWRVGWLIGPLRAIQAATNLQSHVTSNVANVSQRAAIGALRSGLDEVEHMRRVFDSRRLLLYRGLTSIGIKCVEPEGAFYAFPDLRDFLGKRIGDTSPSTTIELAELILDEIGVAIVPGEAFGAPGFARLSYAIDEGSIAEALKRLSGLLGSI